MPIRTLLSKIGQREKRATAWISIHYHEGVSAIGTIQ